MERSPVTTSMIGQPNGVAGLDANGHVPVSQLHKILPLEEIKGITNASLSFNRRNSRADQRKELGSTTIGDALFIASSAAGARTTLGLGTISTQNSNSVSITGGSITGVSISGITDLAVADGGTGASDAATARSNLGLAIGTNVQAYDADLTTWAGLTPSAFFQTLVDDSDAATARATLGLIIGTNVQAYDADLTTWAGLTPSAYFQTLVDDSNAATARGTLGSTTVGDAVFIAASAAAARTAIGVGAISTLAAAAVGIYGNGADSSVTFDGSTTILGMAPSSNTYTMTRDIYCTDITINNGVTVITAGWRLHATGTLTNNGTIHNSGASAVGTTAGAAGPGGSMSGGGAGGAGTASGTTTVTGTASTAVNARYHCLGGRGGNGGGSNGGTSAALVTIARVAGFKDIFSLAMGIWTPPGGDMGSAPSSTANLGGGSGGAGGGRTTGGTATASGAGGGGGGICYVAARIIVNSSGTIKSHGGDGSAATGGTCVTGGGGGGGGGVVIMLYDTLTAGTETVAGGVKGAGLNGASAAADGSVGLVIKVPNTA